MRRYIILILIFIVFIILTMVNILDKATGYATLDLIVVETPPLPGIILLYLGIVIGALLTIPVMMYHIKKGESKVLNQHMKNESKRMKKIKNKGKEKTASKKTSNINSDVHTSKSQDINSSDEE